MRLLLLLLLCVLTLSCEFGTRQQQEPETLLEAPVSSQVINYEVERIAKALGPCATDSTATRCLNVSIEYPKINATPLQQAIATINRNIQSDIFAFTAFEQKPESFEFLINELMEEYESILTEFPDYERSWSLEINSDIIYQDSAYVSVATTIYSYTGGAHPNSYQVYRSYDLETGNSIGLEDILAKGYEETLNEAGEIEFRMLKEIPPELDLEDRGYMFEHGSFGLNDNFAIINKSLIFYFNPYEIAPYAMGPTELELKLTDYADLINPDGLLSRLVD